MYSLRCLLVVLFAIRSTNWINDSFDVLMGLPPAVQSVCLHFSMKVEYSRSSGSRSTWIWRKPEVFLYE